MIVIDNRPVPSDLIEKYSLGSVERRALDILSASGKRYNFSSREELEFELRLRREIVEAAKALNKSKFGFAVFRKSRANPKYWNRTNDGGFSLKRGARPSEAINDIFINGEAYRTECATAMVIVYYKALLDIYGPELFDRVFSSIRLMNWHYIDKNLQEIGRPQRAADYLPGDRRYFSNPDVDPLTPEMQGENVIDMGGGYFYGHDVGIRTANEMIQILNQARRRGADDSAYLMDSAGRPDFKRLYRIYAQRRL